MRKYTPNIAKHVAIVSWTTKDGVPGTRRKTSNDLFRLMQHTSYFAVLKANKGSDVMLTVTDTESGNIEYSITLVKQKS